MLASISLWVRISVFYLSIVSTNACSKEVNRLDGTWALDPQATEFEILKNRPFESSDEFRFATHFYSGLVFDFVGPSLFVRGYVEIGQKMNCALLPKMQE